MDYVLGVDLGTSYFKLGVFDRKGDLRGFGRIRVPKDKGDGARSEIPIDRFWNLLRQGLADACHEAGIHANQIKAVSYSSQANSFALLDKNNQPLTPLILWNDDRAKDINGIQTQFKQQDFLYTTGMGIEPSHQFCVVKLRWFQEHQSTLWEKATRCMTISDYFTFALTGQYIGDAGTASLLGLLNVQTLEWRQNVIDLSKIQFSKPLLPGTYIGGISQHGSELLGLSADIPFVVGSLDHHIAAIGAGVDYIADMSESTGTVLACLRYSSQFSPRKNICTGAGVRHGTFYQLAFDGNGASSLEGYRQVHAPQLTIPDLEKQAERVNIGSDGLIARPSAYSYNDLEGFYNISSDHHHGHFTRAIMESTAASLLRLVEQLAGDDRPGRIVATGGGAKSDLWLQIKADLLGIEFVTTQTEVPACRGAAMLASIAAGWYPDLKAVTQEWVKIDRTFRPQYASHEKYDEWYENKLV